MCACYQSHEATGPVPLVDSSVDSGAPRDSGPGDSGWDAQVFVPPPGICTPPIEYRRDRFPGDSQEYRDQSQAGDALHRSCSPGESCAGAFITVGVDGRVDSVEAFEPFDEECVQEALLGLCLPSLVGGAAEVQVCGV